MLRYFKITIRFRTETPTIQLRLDDGKHALDNLASIKVTFESRYDFEDMSVTLVEERETSVNI